MIASSTPKPEPKTVTRTMRIPVAEVIDGGTKAEFYEALRASLRMCTAAVNRCLTAIVTADATTFEAVARGENAPRMNSKAIGHAAYHSINSQFEGSARVAAAISRDACRKYFKKRLEMVRCETTLPTQRSCPLPLLKSFHFRVEHDESGRTIVTLWMPATRSEWKVKLKGGKQHAYQLKTIIAGIARDDIRDSSIWMHRKKKFAVVGIAVRTTQSAPQGNDVLRVSTARDSFIVASRPFDRTPFVINGDHVTQWRTEQQYRIQRLRQDAKAGAGRKRNREEMKRLSDKYRQRLDDFTHQSAAAIVKHAIRRKVGVIEFDGLITSYFGSQFPWFEFAEKLKFKCKRSGIEFREVKHEEIPAPKGAIPHVYVDLGVEKGSKVIRNVKIGLSTRAVGRRSKDDSRAKDQDWLTLHYEAARSIEELYQLEKRYLAMFAEHRIDGEMFRAEPVIDWLRETGRLGSAGNLRKIAQVMEV